MKFLFTFFISLGLMAPAMAQKNQKPKTDTAAKPAAAKIDQAAYKTDPKIPAFNLTLIDSSSFTREQLPTAKYDHTFIIYFSPDCGHCQHEATEIVKHMDSLKNAFFVFAAYKPLEDIKGFATYYQLDKFPNIRVGRDPQYAIPSFYRVTRVPFIAMYDKKGLLEKVFDPEVSDTPEARDLIKLVFKN